MSRLLSLISVALALTLDGVTSWGVPEKSPQAQARAPIIVQLITGAQDSSRDHGTCNRAEISGYSKHKDDDEDAGPRQIVVQEVESAEDDASAERGAEGGQGEGMSSDLQLLVPVAVVDSGSQEERGSDGAPRATDSWFSEQRGPAVGAVGAGSAGSASLIRLLQALLSADRAAPPRAPAAPTVALTHHHDRAQSTSVCPACLMLKALKMLQLQSSLKSLAGGQGGASDVRGVSAANGRGANCAVCVLELQHARRLAAARAGGGGGEGGGGWDAPNYPAEGADGGGVHIVA